MSNTVMVVETVIPAVVGFHSLVGMGTDEEPFPLSFGNYFRFHPRVGFNPLNPFSEHYRCLNMWAENFKELAERLKIETVKVAIFEDQAALVIDKRVPSREWFISADYGGYGGMVSYGVTGDVMAEAQRYYMSWLETAFRDKEGE